MVVYVLELEKEKFYVGRTNNINRRYDEHCNGNGSAWTKKYKPLRIFKTYEEDDSFYEDMIVKKMMKAHGIDSVRGGSYSQIILPSMQITFINNEFRGADDKCFHCGGDHFIHDCNQSSDKINKDKMSYREALKIAEETDECVTVIFKKYCNQT